MTSSEHACGGEGSSGKGIGGALKSGTGGSTRRSMVPRNFTAKALASALVGEDLGLVDEKVREEVLGGLGLVIGVTERLTVRAQWVLWSWSFS